MPPKAASRGRARRNPVDTHSTAPETTTQEADQPSGASFLSAISRGTTRPKASTSRPVSRAADADAMEMDVDEPYNPHDPSDYPSPPLPPQAPRREPAARLASSRRKEASGPVLPAQTAIATASASASASGEGAASATTTGAKKVAAKYKPKAGVRRTAAEREAAEKSELQRQQQRLREEKAERARQERATRGRGRGGRESGGLGRKPFEPIEGSLSGVFGGGVAVGGMTRGGGRIGGGGGGGSRRRLSRHRSRATTEVSEADGSVRPLEDEDDAEFLSSDQDSGAERMNIETINLSSDDESSFDEAEGKGKERAKSIISGKGKEKSKNDMKPVRIIRREHIDRSAMAGPETLTPATQAQPTAKAVTEAKPKPAPADDQSLIKREPTEDVDSIMTGTGTSTPTSFTALDSNPNGDTPAPILVSSAGVTPAPQSEPRQHVLSLLKLPPPPTIAIREEREEYERGLENIKILCQDLAEQSLTSEPTSTSKDETKPRPRREDHLFLLHMPTITPSLTNPSATITKTEPDSTTAQSTIDPAIKEEGSAPIITSSRTLKNPPPAPISSTTTIPPSTSNMLTATYSTPMDRGRVGKLRVHASGKVSVSWGGNKFAVMRGVEGRMGQEVVCVGGDGKAVGGAGGEEGSEVEAMPLGVLGGKLVVVPDWGVLLS